MAENYIFHIRNAHPGDLVAVLATLDAYPDLRTIAEVVIAAKSLGLAVRDRQRLEALITARELGLVEPDRNKLTSTGQLLSSLEMANPDLFPDLVHGLQYARWDAVQPGIACFSWSYRTLCRLLWTQGVAGVDDRRALASAVEAQIREVFGKPDISFSPKSVGGALLWLAELSPAVLDDDGTTFHRRTFCPPELFILAVDFVYRSEGVDYGANLLLTEVRQEAICQMCLLEPDGFERVLKYTVVQFDYLEQGLGGGWGRFLLLHRAPQLEDFLP